MKISTVINTYNEEKNIGRCLESIKNFSEEIIVVDMHSTDKTVEIAKKFKAKIFFHEYTRYVEPARNFALSKATGDWILLLDADEELSQSLFKELIKIAKENTVDFVEIPRKNIIFNKWILHSRWWPDYLVRFFKRGKVKFSEEIHVPPVTSGKGQKLLATEENTIVHYNFQTISQFIERFNRYSDIESEQLISKGYDLDWKDIIFRPANEFFSRFFAGDGYKDGLHGLVLSLLQAFSEFVVYLKIWEKDGFKENSIPEIENVFKKVAHDFYFWQGKSTSGLFMRIRLKIKSKI
ncbi:glycosyltransferase family 2 protein [Candidatus Shapirobacteria bacterium CG03_land_8_20_14_0_80_39_12]|uniref:Glycosyltransferase family 2 protein n=1 Tax=Candidatus Shapirobacteria bacterium CG03_land_8_20_14_0_80_39_12 TaxID=1974879 RepID=A0A2M7BAM3_9BACT|nr:MAG: glycosyltransferase family 2 protein [Candidatus Shapirobacteria bacterium CG03_land_8_20_14_0_80_39_12]